MYYDNNMNYDKINIYFNIEVEKLEKNFFNNLLYYFDECLDNFVYKYYKNEKCRNVMIDIMILHVKFKKLYNHLFCRDLIFDFIDIFEKIKKIIYDNKNDLLLTCIGENKEIFKLINILNSYDFTNNTLKISKKFYNFLNFIKYLMLQCLNCTEKTEEKEKYKCYFLKTFIIKTIKHYYCYFSLNFKEIYEEIVLNYKNNNDILEDYDNLTLDYDNLSLILF
jgi:hypothetical protein